MSEADLQSYLEEKFQRWRPAPPVVVSRTQHGVTLTWEQDGTSFAFMKEHFIYRIEIKQKVPPWRVVYSGKRTSHTVDLEPLWPHQLRLRAALPRAAPGLPRGAPGLPRAAPGLAAAAAAGLAGTDWEALDDVSAEGDDDNDDDGSAAPCLWSRCSSLTRARAAPPPPAVPAFSMAVSCGYVPQIQQMLEARPELVDALDAATGLRPLATAARAGNINSVRVLLSAGADVNLASSAGQTPLHVAAYLGRAQIVEMLLERGADAQLLDGTGHSSARLAAAGGAAGADHVLRLLAARDTEH